MSCSLIKNLKVYSLRLGPHGVMTQDAVMVSKNTLPQTGIDPMPLAFKASLLTRFRRGWDRTPSTRFQGKFHVNCTSGATLHKWGSQM